VIKRAIPPKLLEYSWGGGDMKWELEPSAGGTRLTLWHNIDKRFISWGAAGWHICFDVLDRALDGHPIGRMVGPEVMKFDGWQRLTAEYKHQFDAETAMAKTPSQLIDDRIAELGDWRGKTPGEDP
jgi:hypothetical protein